MLVRLGCLQQNGKVETCFDFQQIIPFHQNAKMPASAAKHFPAKAPPQLTLKMFKYVQIMIAHLCEPGRTS